MNDHPVTPATTPLPDPGDLQRQYGDRWQIELESTLGVWSALRRSPDGRQIRCIIGRSAAELMAKLETAETVEPPEATPLTTPPCPECGAVAPDVAWTGGGPPRGPDNWQCTACGHEWSTTAARP